MTKDAGKDLVQQQGYACLAFFWSGSGLRWRMSGCRNADAGVNFLDANAQLCLLL
jgi:hypothetical protein